MIFMLGHIPYKRECLSVFHVFMLCVLMNCGVLHYLYLPVYPSVCLYQRCLHWQSTPGISHLQIQGASCPRSIDLFQFTKTAVDFYAGMWYDVKTECKYNICYWGFHR